MKYLKWTLIFTGLFMALAFTQSSSRQVSVKMDSKFYIKGRVVHATGDIYYNFTTGKMVSHFVTPMDYYLLMNNKGEAQVYYPKSNEVVLTRGMDFNTEKTLLYYFLANKIYDLGLKDLGFSMTHTRFEEGHMISEWSPKGTMKTSLSKIELVHKNYLPIYLGYYNTKKELVQKIFYYNYRTVKSLNFPQKVVEITYLPDGDSTVKRMAYSGFSFGINPDNEKYFNFSVPKSAKIVENED